MYKLRKFLSFDIGGSFIKYGVLIENGNILYKDIVPTEAHRGGQFILNKVKEIGNEILTQHTIDGICISTAGQVDSREGKILYAIPSIIPDYTGLELKKELQDYFHLPVEVENDVNCVGLAESWLGTGKDVNSLFCLTIGTGIGGSYILDNKLHTGHSYSGGEIGYIPIEGKQFQELASTRILIKNVAKVKGIPEDEIDGFQIFEQAKSGDEICIQAIDRMCYYLSKGIATIAYMMNPEMIVIGGGISAQKDYLRPIIMEYLQTDLIPSILKNTKIEFAYNQNDAGIIGALRHFLLKEAMQPLNKVITMIESNQHKLTKREKVIASYILNNMNRVPDLTISHMSLETGVSEATITRFCQKTGIGSYNQLRLMTKEGIASSRTLQDSGSADLKETKYHYLSMLEKFDTLYESTQFDKLRASLLNSERVFIYCTDEIATILEQLKYKFLNFGIYVNVFSNNYQFETSRRLLSSDIVVLGISFSGYDESIIQILQYAKELGADTYGITNQKDSPLSNVANSILLIPTTNQIKNESSIQEVAIYYLIDVILNKMPKQASALNDR